MKSKRIIAVHLLNDWSGSPLVFRQALEALQQTGADITLFTATPSSKGGFLTGLTGVTTHEIPYRWHPSRFLTLWYYLNAQLHLFTKLLFSLQPADCVYINTLLPFGAAMAGWLRGCQVIYHVHEVSLRPFLLKRWLIGVANITARQVLFVSEYARQQTALIRPECRLVYNALPEAFTKRASQMGEPISATPFTALMLCSNKTYKGVREFVATARILPHIRFLLVLNAKPAEVDTFIQQTLPPENCFIYPAQTDTIPFYQQAHVVLNLSHPNAWVETFGMTALEAMACGRPVIVPPVGGICELINDGKEGFMVTVEQPLHLIQTLRRLSSDMNLYLQMAQAARQRATLFSARTFRRQITDTFFPAPAKSTAMYKMENPSRIRKIGWQ